MKNLKEYLQISEAKFSTKEFYKHSYAHDCIAKILSGGPVRLGATGEDSFTVADTATLSQEFAKYGDDITPEQFNDIMIRHGLPTWTQIFKGDFSGYKDGLASKNKGNEFELKYFKNFSEQYQSDLERVIGLNPGELDGVVPVMLGSKNQKRPLQMGPHGPILGCDKKTIGDKVVDIFIPYKQGYNLSLKSGSTLAYCNTGITRMFTPKSFEIFKKTGIYTPENDVVDGQAVLDLFHIDNTKFANTFIQYKSGIKNDKVDITDELRSNRKAIFDFIESAIGYGYILVHEIRNNKIEYTDLRTPADLKKYIGNNINSAVIKYGGEKGDGKRVVVSIEFTNIKVNVTFRSKDGGVYPSHIMVEPMK